MIRLTSERYRRIGPILDAALDLPPDEREAYLARACEGDDALRAEIERLVEADARDTGVLERPSGEYIADLFGVLRATHDDDVRPSTLAEGEIVGAYRIVRSIAQGGMGEVFEAERADGQFEQRVALKLIRRGVESPEIRRRFLQERRILARLQHPAIARLLDGGITDREQPWFAMELVEGEPITVYCDARRLPIERRLELFETVCDAVQYAHRNLVVHRDLKPSNIFVTPDGQVKLLDFGIAKLLPTGEVDADDETKTQWRVLTPEYAAPEQVRGDAVTAATDVYALGVVLYQLLTGYRAHRFERSTPGEVERVVCEQMPAAPSRIVATDATYTRADGSKDEVDPEQVAQLRSTTPDRLRRTLSGDLDTIVLTALRKEPERRYGSVEAMREDIRRYRHKLPIEARPISPAYRVGRFIQRQKLLVGSAVALLLVLVAGLASTTWQARRATREAERAKAVRDFVVQLFEAASPANSLGREITAGELLEVGTLRVDSLLADQPEVHAELLATLASLQYKIGNFARAESLATRAVERWRALGAADELPASFALVEIARSQLELGNLDAADSALTQALRIRERELGPDHYDVVQVIGGLASVARLRGEYVRAESLHSRAYDYYRRRFGDDHLEVTHSLNGLAVVASDQGNLERADSLYARAIAIRQAAQPPDHPDVLTAMENRASLLGQMGRLDESIAMLRDVLARRIRVQGEGHPDAVWTMGALANRLDDRGELAAAESLQTLALQQTRKFQPPGSPEIARLVNNLATLNYRMERFDTAIAYQREAIESWTATLGANHPSVVTGHTNLGIMLTEVGGYREAETLLREALAARLSAFQSPNANIAGARRALGVLYHRQGRLAEAEAMLRPALDEHIAALDSTNPRVAQTMLALGELLCDRGNRDEGRQHLRRALAIREKELSGSFFVAEAQRALATCLEPSARAEAESLLTAAYSIVGDDPYKQREAERIRRALEVVRARQ
jgi:serine/threonine-protein kinase